MILPPPLYQVSRRFTRRSAAVVGLHRRARVHPNKEVTGAQVVVVVVAVVATVNGINQLSWDK